MGKKAKTTIYARIKKWNNDGVFRLGEWWLIEKDGQAHSGMAYAKFLPSSLPRMLEAMERLGIAVEMEEARETPLINPAPSVEASEFPLFKE